MVASELMGTPSAFPIEDTASVAENRYFQTRHLDLFFDVSFEASVISGRVDLFVDRLAADKCVLNLDVHELDIHGVTDVVTGAALQFEVSPFADFGSRLAIRLPEPPAAGGGTAELPSGAPATDYRVRVAFTAGRGAGLCWLAPSQTAGKVHPYLFTQGQACLNRTWFPCQDTPAIKATFAARVLVPHGLQVMMGAERLSAAAAAADGKAEFTFHMAQPIPSYLVAMVCGDIASASIGPRSRVWAEPSVLEAARHEFEGWTEKYIAAAEQMFGPYLWENYDLVVMPPSFPYGGMEVPRLTFVTPCLLTGDHSLCDVVAHEIAHSWFGNLVTNGSWAEFWMNEGFTMYAQRRITEQVHGVEFTALEARTGQSLLGKEVQELGPDSNLTCLSVKIADGVDPDDTYSEVAYEKGYCFVRYLEQLVGDRDAFTRFLASYVQEFKFSSIVPEDLFALFFRHFPHLRDNTGPISFDAWLHTPGLPAWVPDLSAAQSLAGPAEALAAAWLAFDPLAPEPPAGEVGSFDVYSLLHFLDTLVDAPDARWGSAERAHALLARLDAAHQLSKSRNAEVSLRWSQLTLRFAWQPDFPNVEAFLLRQGKLKYQRPLYQALVRSAAGRELAKRVFAQARPALHGTVVGYVEKILAAGAESGQ